MEIVNKKIEELIPYVKNPRNNDSAVKYVAESIKNFGFKVPIVIDKKGEIVTGHTRLKAAKKLGLKMVPCVIADDLTETQIKAFRIADNRVAEFSTWNLELLNEEMQELKFEDVGFDFEGFGILKADQNETLEEINTVEVKPYKKVHYLISADINLNDEILEIISKLEGKEGIEIESTSN